jgi:hypothetical protein
MSVETWNGTDAFLFDIDGTPITTGGVGAIVGDSLEEERPL